jgi:hypothetical protein
VCCETCCANAVQRRSGAMPDVAFVLLTVVLFAVLAVLVRAVEKL